MSAARPVPRRAESEDERRRRRRALIRAHHPDIGGDTADFTRLLHQFDHEHHPGATAPEVRFVSRRRWWKHLMDSIPRLRRTSRRPRRTA